MSADAAAAKLRGDLDGERIGTQEGAIICDGCHSRLDLARPSEERQENVENPHSETFTAYATRYSTGWETRRIWCMDCDEREIEVPTGGAEEAMVELNVEFIGISVPPCMVIDADVIEYSGEEEGER